MIFIQRILLVISTLLVQFTYISDARNIKNVPLFDQQILDVNFCDLIVHPREYNGKIIRVHTSYLTTFDWNTLYNTNCLGKDNYIKPFLDCNTSESCHNLQKRLSENLSGNPFDGSRADIIVVGQFKIIQQPKFHNSNYKLAMYIKEVEKTMKIPDDVPWIFRK